MLRLEKEVENLRAAWDYARAQPQPQLWSRLALVLARFFEWRGMHDEAKTFVEQALTGLPAQFDSVRSALLRRQASLALDQCDWELAALSAAEAVELAERKTDEPNSTGSAEGRNLLGLAQMAAGDFAAARANLGAALTGYGAAADEIGQAKVRNNLGLLEAADPDGDASAVQAHLKWALAARRRLHDQRGQAETLVNLGVSAEAASDFDEASRCYRQALGLELLLTHRVGVGRALNNLGEVAFAQNDSMSALRLFLGAHALFSAAGLESYADHANKFLTQLATRVATTEIRRLREQMPAASALALLAQWALND